MKKEENDTVAPATLIYKHSIIITKNSVSKLITIPTVMGCAALRRVDKPTATRVPRCVAGHGPAPALFRERRLVLLPATALARDQRVLVDHGFAAPPAPARLIGSSGCGVGRV